VGLQLAKVSLAETQNPQAFLSSLASSQRHILAYLQEEVLAGLSQVFRDMLRTELMAKDPEIVPVLYQRAIQWFVLSGKLGQAVQYCLEGGLPKEAAEIIDEHLDELIYT